jgi:hypothetical protein
MRAETRPEGREAVERVHVSGTVEVRAGWVNQLWNCVNGDSERSVRCSVPMLNWAAWVVVGSVPGANISFEEGLGGCEPVLVMSLWDAEDVGWSGGLPLACEGVCSILRIVTSGCCLILGSIGRCAWQRLLTVCTAILCLMCLFLVYLLTRGPLQWLSERC